MDADPRRQVPRTDALLAEPPLAAAVDRLGRDLVKTVVQQVQQRIRSGELPGVTTWATLHDLLAEGHTPEEIFADPVHYLGEEGRALVDLPTVTARLMSLGGGVVVWGTRDGD